MIEFRGFPKIPRLFRDVVISEKIDGTNAAIHIEAHPFGTHVDGVPAVATAFVFGPMNEGGTPDVEYVVGAQSRKRLITPAEDNFGFARWVHDNAAELVQVLGEGTHYGEWWGHGIQRGYGLGKGDRRFSLFNTHRFGEFSAFGELSEPEIGLGVVPVLYGGPFHEYAVEDALNDLRAFGSYAVEGYRNPEGIVIYHEAARQSFKVLLENDDRPKSAVADEAA